MKDPDSSWTKVHVDLPNHPWGKEESLRAKALGADAFEIESIPMFAYGLNHGDVVLATPNAQDSKPVIRSVLRRSGNQTLRMSFCDRLSDGEQLPVIAALQSMGAELERVNAQFVRMTIPQTIDLKVVRDYLVTQQSSGVLEFENCEERVAGSFDDRPRSKGSVA